MFKSSFGMSDENVCMPLLSMLDGFLYVADCFDQVILGHSETGHESDANADYEKQVWFYGSSEVVSFSGCGYIGCLFYLLVGDQRRPRDKTPTAALPERSQFAANGCLTSFRRATTSEAFGSPAMARAMASFVA